MLRAVKRKLNLITVSIAILLILVPLALSIDYMYYDKRLTQPPQIVQAFFVGTENNSRYITYSLDYGATDSKSHWYAGAIARNYVYYTAKELSFQLTVPDEKPPYQNYYVLLSCFDNNDSYNQIGIQNYYGTWKVIFSWSSVHGPWWSREIRYHTYRLICVAGRTYLFRMIADGKGNIKFQAYYRSGSSWIKQSEMQFSTGGTYFVVDDTYYFKWIIGWGAHDFTDYEEFWSGSPNTPTYDFDFVNTKIVLTSGQTIYFNSWQEYYVNSPSGVVVYLSTNHVYIDNPNQ
ncbi:MAG: hypothetical protein ACP6IU_06745 [Candidatus Asgardarchaeia archaeon]